ncbi:hypothetical protein WJX72_008414 [[Myrmecia] bisecta]|uniref:U-box domain-containing protein n=1 Tax=[Myrmecia] bisecta TaxID=41462 RepID=A0AAW1Q7R0_9CHLO
MEVVRKLCNTLRTVGPMAYPAAPDAPPSALQILLCKEGATALVCLKLMASGDLTVQGELVRFLASLLAKSSYTAEATPAQMQLCSRLLKGPAFVEQLCALSLTCSQPTSCVQYAPVLAGSGYELAAPAAELAGSLAVMACGCLATLAEDPAALPAMAKARVLDFAGSLLMERAKETKHLPEPLLWQALLLAKRLSPKDAGAHVFIFWNPLMLAALTRMAQATAVDAEHRDVAVWALKEAFAADSLLANVAFKEKVPAKDRETVMAWGDFMDVLHGCYYGAETLRSHCGPPFGVVANLRLLVAVVRGMAVPTYGVHRGQVPMYDRDECADLLKDHLLDIPVLLCGEDIKEGPETLRSFADEALDRVVNTPQDERGRTLLRLVAEAILHNPALQYAEMLASPARIDRLFAALSGNDSLPLLGTRTFLESYGLMLSLLGVMLEANAARGLTLSPSEGRDHMFLAVVTVAFQDCIKEEPIVSSCFMSCLRFLGALKLLKLDWYFSFPDRWLRNLRTAGEHGDTWRKMTLIHPLRTCMRVLDKAVALGNNASAARNTASRTALAEATAFMLELLVCPWYDQHPPVADMLRELGAGPKLLALLKAPAGLVPLPEELRQRIMAMKFVQEADMAAEAAASVLMTQEDARQARAAAKAAKKQKQKQKKLHPKERLPLVDMEAMCCPITQEVMRDPVIAIDGHTYERSAIEEWFAKSNISPMTGAELDDPLATIIPNIGVRRLIECYAAVDGA